MKIALLGDVAFFGRFDAFKDPRVFSYFKRMRSFLSDYDYVVANLEAPFLVDGRSYGSKSAYIKSHPSNVELLKYLGINVVSLANNHIFDYGVEGYKSTIEVLNSAGIKHFGSCGDSLFLDDVGGRVAFHGYCSYNTNPLFAVRDDSNGVNSLDYRRVLSRAIDFHRQGFLNIISVHSGQEHVNYPSRDDIRFARKLASRLPYVYYGHHPHVVQGFECPNGSAVAYSLGNFCFDDVYTSKSKEPLVKQTDNNKTGAVLCLSVEGGVLVEKEVMPFYLGDREIELDAEGLRSRFDAYSEALLGDMDDYVAVRSKKIRLFIDSRKEMRDIRWYLVRMRWSSIGIVLRAKYNAYMYKRYYARFLSDD